MGGVEEGSSQCDSDDIGSMGPHMEKVASKGSVESTFQKLTERMNEVQLASETRCKALHAELGDLRLQVRRATDQQATATMHVALEERCCILEARQNAQLEQVKCSEELSGSTVEAVAQRLTDLEEKSEKHCASLEARIGSTYVPDLVSSTADRIHRRISTVQAMMDRRCSTMESQVCALHKDIGSCRSLQEGNDLMRQVED